MRVVHLVTLGVAAAAMLAIQAVPEVAETLSVQTGVTCNGLYCGGNVWESPIGLIATLTAFLALVALILSLVGTFGKEA